MTFSWDQLIVWIIIGLIVGNIVGRLFWDEKKGLHFQSFALGLVGAVIGGLIFGLFGILPNLDLISISLRDIVSAFVGSLIVLMSLWIWKRYRGSDGSHSS